MEIVFQTFNTKSVRIKLSGLLAGLMILFTSCTHKETTVPEIQSKDTLQKIIDGGYLLNSFSQEGDTYVFNFENSVIRIPRAQISDVSTDMSHWQTTVTYSNGTQLVVPSKGGSLDFIVENIKLNPSGYNPLAALVEVNLPTYGRVKVTVHGKSNDAATISHLCQGQTVRQSIPIFGLYANYNNDIDLTFTDKDGNERGTTTIHIQTEALPTTNFPILKLVKTQPQKMEPGVSLVSYPGISELDLSIPYMLDCNGDIRWILLLKSNPDLATLSASIGLKRTQKGTFICGDQSQQRIVEIDMFGNLLHQWDLSKLGYTFHHEVTEAQNGNYLITVTKSSARLQNGQPRVYDHIIELDPFNNIVAKEWDLANILDTSRYLAPDGITPPQFSQNPTNWLHNNSIKEMGNNLLATGRYQGIFSFTHEGKLRWIISPHKLWSAPYRPYLLTPIDENGNAVSDPAVVNGDASTVGFDWAWGPHTPFVLSDDHILVFDNGYNRNWISNTLTNGNNYSRVVEYKIDVNKMTVQQVWSYGKERGVSCFAEALSGVQYLPNTKNILFCPGMGVQVANGYGGRIVELNPITKEIIFEMEIAAPGNTGFHRVTRMPLYPDSI
ncbi:MULTISPECIES: aryl-sulfate sulfotransferase [Chitinophagaceae]